MARIVVVGCGFAGLNFVKGLKNSEYEIIIIDKSNHHLFQPLLYQVATAAVSPGEIAYPIREIFAGAKNVTTLMGEVVEFRPKNKRVVLGNGETIDYDYLVISVGARHSYFGNNTWAQFAPGLKNLSDALKIRDQVLISFEKAERVKDPEKIKPFLTFVVIGGGPTGVEMSGAISEIARTSLVKNFRNFNPEDARVILVEAFPRILPVYPEKLSERAKQDLEKLGVDVWVNRKVTKIDEHGVTVDDEFIETENIIWAAGNEAPHVLSTLGVEQDRAKRIIVQPDLSIKEYPHIFVLGDCGCCLGKDGKPLPGIAPTAIQQGQYLSKIFKKHLQKQFRPPFSYFDKGMMATIGKSKAVAVSGKFQFSGLLAWLAWCFIHVVYLVGFKNRLLVMMRWAGIFFTGQRGVRLIYREIDKALKNNHS
jgi:NADH:ubiquinone reductase (H+-translocating)